MVILLTYNQALTDTWAFIVDNDFALEIFHDFKQDCIVPPRSKTEHLCQYCQKLDLSDQYFRIEADVATVCKRAQQCDFCFVMNQAFKRLDVTRQALLYRDCSTLRIQGIDRPALSICRGLNISKLFDDIQIGFPDLPQQEDGPRFNVIRQWLKHCDHHHTCSPTDPAMLPTRVIDVGLEDQTMVRLCGTQGCRGKYVALSHRWGNTDINPPFSTNRDNIETRMRGIHVIDLPVTFQDAVNVTRKLGMRYLWIDSICIIQGSDGDWDEEAKRMEDVFSSAYCVVAATRASGTADGFLKPPSSRSFVTFPDGLESCFYVCEAIDDFDQHVTQADLNKRGWVYQERALARRTIHFTKEQMYWECGDGIRCETLTKMKK